MTYTDILNEIYKFYPRNVSSFTELYHFSDEHKRLMETIAMEDRRWQNFMDQMIGEFGHEYVRDRSDSEPSKRCIIYIDKGDILFEFFIHISVLIPYYSYFMRKHSVDRKNLVMHTISERINTPFEEMEKETEIMLQSIKTNYNYLLMPKEQSDLPLPEVSTRNRDLGKVIMFNAVFADTEL